MDSREKAPPTSPPPVMRRSQIASSSDATLRQNHHPDAGVDGPQDVSRETWAVKRMPPSCLWVTEAALERS